MTTQKWTPNTEVEDYGHRHNFPSAAAVTTTSFSRAEPTAPSGRPGVLKLNRDGEHDFTDGCSFPSPAVV